MALSEQDREWARSIVETAIALAVKGMTEYTHTVVNAHANHCPNVSRVKYILIGICLMLGTGAGSAFTAPLIKMLTGQ